MGIKKSNHIYWTLNAKEKAYVENVRKSVSMNRLTPVLYDNNACEHAVKAVNLDLWDLWEKEEDRRYKSDMCRICAIYMEGGYYMDADMVSVEPVVSYVHPETEFVSALAPIAWVGFFQSFMAGMKGHPIFKLNAEIMVKKLRKGGDERELIGPVSLKKSYDELL